MYCWKAAEGLVPNFGVETFQGRMGQGRFLRVPKTQVRARSLREKSLTVEGPLLFNCLPPHIRNFSGAKETFKKHLDEFLQIIPDEPVYSSDPNGCVRQNGMRSNNIRDWVRKLRKEEIGDLWNVPPEFDGID